MEHENSRFFQLEKDERDEKLRKKKTAVKTKQNMMDWYGLLVYVEG